MADKVTKWSSVLTPGDDDPRHGINGYTNLGCRCEICRAANTAYNLQIRQTRRKRIIADPSLRPHGVESTYYNWRCPCDECLAAHARRSSERYHRKRNSTAASP